jgi:hypothetical protein
MYCSVNVLAPTITGGPLVAALPRDSSGRLDATTSNASSATDKAPSRVSRRRVAISASRISASSATASTPALAQPSKTASVFWVCSPLKIRLPRLEAPTGVESVAMPTVQTAAVRMPATITGTESGSCTRHRIWLSVMPMPRAASSTLASTSSAPVTALRSTGSML